jgi:hypothetical protein
MSPTLDDDLSLAQRVENLAVEQLIAKEVVEQVEHPILASIVGVILDEVIGPDMIALLWPMLPERRSGATLAAALGPARYSHGNTRGLEVPPRRPPAE